jgi:hypothetical protein
MLLATAAILIFSGAAASASVECKDVTEMRVTFATEVRGFNGSGRLPTSGVLGGFANNLWQTVRHSSDPSSMGCIGQTSRLAEELRDEYPGWTFDQRFEFGFSSPILLPHAWVTATDAHGHVIDLDPWTNEFTIRKAAQ